VRTTFHSQISEKSDRLAPPHVYRRTIQLDSRRAKQE
jgi:hypothetical protein